MIIAIDPGLSGGIAWAKDGKYEAVPMPNTLAEIRDVLDKARMFYDPLSGCDGLGWHGYYESVCYLEKVHSMTQQGVKSTWTFAEHYGALKAILLCLAIPTVDVRPEVWQKAIGASRPAVPKEATRAQKTRAVAEGKKRIKSIVEARFPSLKVTLKTADALGILMYGLAQPQEVE